MKAVEVTCDGCGRDLTTTGNSIDYRLALANERLPSRGGCVTDMMIYPPIKRDAHFCGMACLKKWAEVNPPPIEQPTERTYEEQPEGSQFACIERYRFADGRAGSVYHIRWPKVIPPG